MNESKRSPRSASDSAETSLAEPAAHAYVALRLDPLCGERIDELADLASEVLQRKISRAMVVRAAVREWLMTNEGADPARLVEAVRASLLKRGRRSHKEVYLRIAPLEETAQEEPKRRIRLRRKPSW